MNILIAANYASPYGGNFIGSLMDLAERMRQNGHRMFFIFPKVDCGERDWVQWIRRRGFEVETIDLTLSEATLLSELVAIINKNRIDLLHLHFGMYHRIVRKYATYFRGLQVLIHDHMGYTPGVSIFKQKAQLCIHSLYYQKNKYGLITVSRYKRKPYIFTAKKWYVPNGISQLRNVSEPLTRDQVRKELQLADETVLCLLLGWDLKRKGVDIAVKAVAYLRDAGYPVVLGLVGQGGDDWDRYHDFVANCGIASNGECVKYIKSREDIFGLHRAADVFLSASRNEGFPYSVLEAISQDSPIVLSDIPETKWAKKYSRAVSYPTEDYVACGNAILSAMKLRETPSNGKQITSEYSIDTWCNRIMEIYHIMQKK